MDLSPKYNSTHFQCPHCQVASQQSWFNANKASEAANKILSHVFYDYRTRITGHQQNAITDFIQVLEVANNEHISELIPNNFSVTTCSTCREISIFVNGEVIYPKQTSVAPPNKDMEQEIQDLYIEASTIVVDSPKGATALLRLALQLLLKQIGKSGKNINNDIKDLVSEGLDPVTQKALDLLRVVGNNAVHPGQIDLEDGRDIALKLFYILNFIAHEMITKPKEITFFYHDVVPEETKKDIKERDGK